MVVVLVVVLLLIMGAIVKESRECTSHFWQLSSSLPQLVTHQFHLIGGYN